MNKKPENRHMVDTLFVITLFCLFAVCSITVIAVGARVYQNTIQHMETHFTANTSIAYITEKIRQCDTADAVSVDDYNGQNILCLKQEIDGTVYCTYLYTYDGYLRELFVKDDFPIDPAAGQTILPVRNFLVQSISDSLLKVTIIDRKSNINTVTIATKCDKIQL